MSVLVGKDTRLLVQGITGSAGGFHAKQMVEYGTQVVAGVTPGRGGEKFDGGKTQVPVFDTVAQAVKATGANASVHLRPAPGRGGRDPRGVRRRDCRSSCASPRACPSSTCSSVRRVLEGLQGKTRLIGPNCPGIITPGACKIGIMPGHIHKAGHIGVVSRSGTLTYEAVGQLTALGVGSPRASASAAIRWAAWTSSTCLELFQADPDTHGVILIGEIGGGAEERAARFIKEKMNKPVAGFIAGTTAPPGKRMGHAGAIIAGGKGTAAEKIEALESAGVRVAPTPSDMASTLVAMMKK